MNHLWHPIWDYSDAALRRMASNTRDMRSEAARRELDRRAAGIDVGRAVHASSDREPQPSDGPDYHAEHAAWRARNPGSDRA